MSVETNLRELFGVNKQPDSFDHVAITVANPETIRSWSKGEVQNPETINYRTFKPEKGGLFCERIFGPTRDWECACGKYKRIKHKGVTCDRCGVEVTLSRVRRERMGHIELAVPVSHIWFYKCMPSRIGLMLDMSARQLERVIYYEDYMVTDPGSTPLERGQLLTEVELRDSEDDYGEDSFRAAMGAEALRDLLSQCKLEEIQVELEEQMNNTRSKQVRKKLAKRLKLAQGFCHSKTRPEWMVLNVLPVIPPDLRPLVPLEGGRFATSDLNDLYRRVINRNNRLKNLLLLKTPEVIIRNEKRMLQEAVDALFDNGRHGRAVTGAGNRALKSLSDMLKGKGGRFRQNLLGKRVDYSGRSVIVGGPELKLGQCGIPKRMALTLFEPFIIRRLKELGYCHTVRSAKKMIDRKTTEVWDILAEVTKGHPVMLNRAPTLHRLSIQAFEPVLIEGSAIRVHPLVCSAYNADFDGDQMAVHVPLSVEAQMETRQLMLAPNNLFSPASGRPIVAPSQDIILGCYYLTYSRNRTAREREAMKEVHLPLFENTTEVEFAIASRKVKYHDLVRLRNPDFGNDSVFGDKESKVIETTAGRVRFNEIFPEGVGFINFNVGKAQMGDLIWRTYQVSGKKPTVKMLDNLKALGFMEAMRSGTSIGIIDMVIPEEKPEVLRNAYAGVEKVTKLYQSGVITNNERYQQVVDIWSKAGDNIANAVYRQLEHKEGEELPNPLFLMVDSGARGNKAQIKQLSGMRGLMAKPSGEIIERPITSNFREGLSVLEYFISTHGARKGLADTALKTADSGYMTRKLVDVSQDVIITQHDCSTVNGIVVGPIYDGDEEVASLSGRVYGRTSVDTVKDPVTGEVFVDANEVISEKQSERIESLGFQSLKIRSVLTCESERGCCATCYGLNLATGVKAKHGEAVGIIAAQSIGEPGTQLTMRTFHTGGVATSSTSGELRQKPGLQIVYKFDGSGSNGLADSAVVEVKDKTTKTKHWIVLKKGLTFEFRDTAGVIQDEIKKPLEIGAKILFGDGDIIDVDKKEAKKSDSNHHIYIEKGSTIAIWDPNNSPIVAAHSGKIEFRDMIVGITVTNETNRETGKKGMVVSEHKEDLHPQVVIVNDKSGEVVASYSVPVGAHLSVKEGQKVDGGIILARTPRKASKTKDITGGLPRIAELFEARRPKDACVIAKLDGVVSFGGTVRGKKKVIVTHEESGETADHLVPMGHAISIADGDYLKRGEQITDGPISPDDLLEACGPQVLQEHLVNEVQEVYRVQGVEINDKHVEVIIRQMLRKVKVIEPGDTTFLWDDQVDRTNFYRENRRVKAEGGMLAECEPVLLGITKASLETDSFISAASFQDTTRVLTEAATHGRVDNLNGFKENVIMGHLIPAGTGFPSHKNTSFEFTVDEPAARDVDIHGNPFEGRQKHDREPAGDTPADETDKTASTDDASDLGEDPLADLNALLGDGTED